METKIRLGRIFGIEIGLHVSWLIIALLIAFSLASHFREVNPNWSQTLTWALAIITGTLFFASIVVHELSHATVARMSGLPVRAITLFALGGVAQIEKEAQDARTEFWMAIVGPITSAVIGFICLTLAGLAGWAPLSDPGTPLMAMLVWLGYINIVLAIFNLIPAFPMDGGRVLRAIIWWVTDDEAHATRRASMIGSIIAHGFIFFGIVSFFTVAGFSGLWLAFIGWFLLQAARTTYAQSEMNESLRGVRVGDVMARDCPVVDGNTNLSTFVDDHLLRSGRRCFLIVEGGEITGLITPQEVRKIERSQWPFTVVYDVMRPLDQLQTVNIGTPVSEAMELIGRSDINQLPVMSADGKLAGVISRDHILRLLTTRAELNK